MKLWREAKKLGLDADTVRLELSTKFDLQPDQITNDTIGAAIAHLSVTADQLRAMDKEG